MYQKPNGLTSIGIAGCPDDARHFTSLVTIDESPVRDLVKVYCTAKKGGKGSRFVRHLTADERGSTLMTAGES